MGTANMSGIVSGINYSLLFPTSTSSTEDASSAILNALYSTATSSGPSTWVSTGNPILDLKIAQQDQTADVAQEALQPQVSQAVTAFKTAVANAPNIQTALANPNVQQVLLTANGLSNYIGETALVQKVFLSNPSDPSSLVNQLGDPTLLSAVQTFNFAQNGLAELQKPSVVSTLSDAYAEVQWRQSLDAATPGLSNALDFLSQASSITSVNDVLDNETNFDVITTALGIPQDIVNQPLVAQQSAITSQLDISKLQDPAYVTSLTDQYLLTMQEQNPSGSSDSTSLTSLAVQAMSLVV
jgi:Protein of unknown function (DUF1217)